MEKPPLALPSNPTPAFLQAEHTRMLEYLTQIGSPGSPGFDESEILRTIDRLRDIEAAMPPEIRAQYAESLDSDDEVPF